MVNNVDASLEILAKGPYQHYTIDELREQYRVVKWNTSKNWLPEFQSGAITGYLNAITNFNKDGGAIENPIPAETYFAP